MKCLTAILISLSLTSSKADIINTSGDKKFCYDREQAEGIFKCLEMKKYYEEQVLFAAPKTDENLFLGTPFGSAFLFVVGVVIGSQVRVK